MRRRRRRLAAWLVMLGLIMGQLTTLAHACPLVEAAAVPLAPMAMPEPCPGMGDAPQAAVTALCAEHCLYGSHAVNTTDADQPAQAPLAFLVVEAPVRLPPVALAVDSLLARDTSPAVFVSSSRLRI